ncbi:MAG TPA: DUF6491 family protein [Steroidobacteraceae bacterium]|nr:DUF6491 family protein [Steroidobacteraceae bacterium]
MKVLILALLVAGCAGGTLRREANERLEDYLSYAGPPVDSFRFFRLYGWQAVGPTRLVIWSTAFDAYLVTVQEPCPRLEFVQRIGVTSTIETVSTLESIVLRDHERCPITQIRPIDLKRMNADRAAQRAAAKASATSGNAR